MASIKDKPFVESLNALAAENRMREDARWRRHRLREAGEMSPVLDEDDEPELEDDPEPSGLDLDSAACAQLQAILAGDGSDSEKIAKIKKIVSDHSDYMGDGEVAEGRRPFGGKRRRVV